MATSRDEEYIRRMRALGYTPTLAGLDDEDIEWELERMDRGRNVEQPAAPQLNPTYRPVDPGLAARIFRQMGRPYDPQAIDPREAVYIGGWDNGEDGEATRPAGPLVPQGGMRRPEPYDPWANTWKLDWGAEGSPAQAPRTMEYRWGRDGMGFPSRGIADRPLSYGTSGHDVGTGKQKTSGAAPNPYAGGYANGGAEGDMLFEVTGVKPMEVGKNTTQNSPAEIKLWADENPDWNNLQPRMKDTTTVFVSEINKGFGTKKTPWITSGYRSPELNASLPEASPNSWHLEGLAVDINLDDYTADERAKIEDMAWKRFREVYWHKGTGWHLHIGDPRTPE